MKVLQVAMRSLLTVDYIHILSFRKKIPTHLSMVRFCSSSIMIQSRVSLGFVCKSSPKSCLDTLAGAQVKPYLLECLDLVYDC
jgi:hypothetical protein